MNKINKNSGRLLEFKVQNKRIKEELRMLQLNSDDTKDSLIKERQNEENYMKSN